MILLSHPTSNGNASATARGLYRHGLLTAYYTCISWNPDSALAKKLPRSITRWLDRRKQIDIPSELIHTRPLRELIRNLYDRTGLHGTGVEEGAPFSTEQVYYDLDRHIARQLYKFPLLKGVYAYDDGALAQFEQAKKMGLTRIYDLPIGHWRELVEVTKIESDAQPEWRTTMKALRDTKAKNQRKDHEIALADVVVVASSYTKKTLGLFPQRKQVVVVPYGMPPVTTAPRSLTSGDSPLRVLFVGQLTQRKGISYLFDAINILGKSATLTLIGTKGGQAKVLDDACQKHRWIETLPHAEVLQEMKAHDVLVFPSLFEGFGLVIGEAMSQGMPVITTANTGGPDIMTDGLEGFIVPIRSAEEIASKLLLLHQDRDLLKHMSDAARDRAMELSWMLYEDRLAESVSAALDASSAQHVNTAGDGTALGQELTHGGVEVRR